MSGVMIVNMIKPYHDRQVSSENPVPKGAVVSIMSEDTMTYCEDTVTDNSVPECIHEDDLFNGNASLTESESMNEVSHSSGKRDLDHEYVVPKLQNSEVIARRLIIWI